mmetsp:Transcript_89523/g.253707  ORF Transcript_89523/g.253707 Transcript_89523/m.253707 type:complete len:241 (-) Transcript_89523:849-1571(-)
MLQPPGQSLRGHGPGPVGLGLGKQSCAELVPGEPRVAACGQAAQHVLQPPMRGALPIRRLVRIPGQTQLLGDVGIAPARLDEVLPGSTAPVVLGALVEDILPPEVARSVRVLPELGEAMPGSAAPAVFVAHVVRVVPCSLRVRRLHWLGPERLKRGEEGLVELLPGQRCVTPRGQAVHHALQLPPHGVFLVGQCMVWCARQPQLLGHVWILPARAYEALPGRGAVAVFVALVERILPSRC